MPATRHTRPPVKGVGFSDHLVVLGPPSSAASQTYIAPRSEAPAPSAKQRSTSLDLPSTRPSRHPSKPHPRFFDHPPQSPSNALHTPPRPYEDSLETSCTESEDDHASFSPPLPETNPFPVQQPYDIEKSTRINTKLNSLPSGGAFSLMNSSEDVDSSSTDEEDHLSSSRRLVRVPGSAKLSTASGLADSDLDDEDEDEFAIEGAERVDEEEAVNVRSFGRSFARVCLKDDLDQAASAKPTKWAKDKSQVSFDVGPAKPPHRQDQPFRGDHPSASDTASAASTPTAQNKLPQNALPACKSAPPSRKSRLRLTFVRRTSVADSGEPESDYGPRTVTTSNLPDDTTSSMTRLSCFPIRRAQSRMRTRSGDFRSGFLHRTRTAREPSTRDATTSNDGPNQLLAVPEFTPENRKFSGTRKNRKMVENISMQRDDWIDFATNSPHRQRSQWLSRLISHSGADSDASSLRDSQALASEAPRQSRSSGWKVWRLLSRKSVHA